MRFLCLKHSERTIVTMKQLKPTLILTILICLLLPINTYAEKAQNGDRFERCSKAGAGTGFVFLPTAATPVTLEISKLDPNYTYYGIDIGVFEKISDTDWTNIFDIEREVTNNTIVEIADFGAIDSYDYDDVYILSYRILYQTPEGSLIEGPWQMDERNCFKVCVPETAEFTDRVTGANKWIQEAVDSGELTEQEVIEKGLNHYFPNSEVVCKFMIDPRGVDVDKYSINLDVNADDTSNIDIDYLKIVKIDYDGVTQWEYKDQPGPPGGADKPLCGKYDGSKTISFEIDNPGDKEVTVWYKYKFTNPDMNNIPDEFRNKVEVTAESGGSIKTLEPKYNTIRLRKTGVNYM